MFLNLWKIIEKMKIEKQCRFLKILYDFESMCAIIISCQNFSKNSKKEEIFIQILKERERESFKREIIRWIVENVLRRNVVVLLSYVDERQRRQSRRGKRNVSSSSSLTRSDKHHCREKVPEKKEKKVDVTESNTTTNLDNLIEGLLATSTPGEVSEKKPETVSTSSESTTTTTTESEKENVPEKVEKKEEKKADVLASLTISGPMGSVSLVSYAKETYDKSCQTMPPRRDSTLSTTSSTNITPDVPVATTPKVEDEEDDEDQSTEEETEEEEDTKTKRINDSTFTSFLNRASTVMERAIQCNEDFDITVEYGLVSDTTESSKEKESFLDLSFKFQSSRWSSSRTVTDVNWSNHYKELVLATYVCNIHSCIEPHTQTHNNTQVQRPILTSRNTRATL